MGAGLAGKPQAFRKSARQSRHGRRPVPLIWTRLGKPCPYGPCSAKARNFAPWWRVLGGNGEVKMKPMRWDHASGQHGRLKAAAAVGVVMLELLFLAALRLGAQDKKDSGKADSEMDRNSIGFIASKEANAKDVGLPLYPGAREHKDKSEGSPAVRLGLWGGNSGFKLAVLKLESNDAPEKVAAFYRKALATYGKVLDCSDSAMAAGEKKRGNSPDEPGCKDEQPESGEIVLKAGTKEEEHVVGIKVKEGLSVFQLVYIETRGSKTEN